MITIEGKKYELFFNMTAIESVMNASQMQDFSGFAEQKSFVQSLKFSRDCAYHGIKAACKRDKISMPFESSEDLGCSVPRRLEIQHSYSRSWCESIGFEVG